jgi:hypothetical protein
MDVAPYSAIRRRSSDNGRDFAPTAHTACLMSDGLMITVAINHRMAEFLES